MHAMALGVGVFPQPGRGAATLGSIEWFPGRSGMWPPPGSLIWAGGWGRGLQLSPKGFHWCHMQVQGELPRSLSRMRRDPCREKGPRVPLGPSPAGGREAGLQVARGLAVEGLLAPPARHSPAACPGTASSLCELRACLALSLCFRRASVDSSLSQVGAVETAGGRCWKAGALHQRSLCFFFFLSLLWPPLALYGEPSRHRDLETLYPYCADKGGRGPHSVGHVVT